MKQSSWSSIVRDPVIGKLLSNTTLIWLSNGTVGSLAYFFIPYLDTGFESIAQYGSAPLPFGYSYSILIQMAAYATAIAFLLTTRKSDILLARSR